MLIEQSGRCEICNDNPEQLDVDHCHITGVVRALLCGPCNRMLGQAHDDKERLMRGIAYLNRFDPATLT